MEIITWNLSCKDYHVDIITVDYHIEIITWDYPVDIILCGDYHAEIIGCREMDIFTCILLLRRLSHRDYHVEIIAWRLLQLLFIIMSPEIDRLTMT